MDEAKFFSIANRANDDFIVLNALQEAGVTIDLLKSMGGHRGGRFRGASFPADEKARRALKRVLPTVSTQVMASLQPPDNTVEDTASSPSRIGLYQPWMPSMDEGWTRLVLEKYGFKYTTLHPADIRAGSLKERVDVLLIPSIEPKTLRDGFAENETEPAYVGGLGSEGAERSASFSRRVGRSFAWRDSTDYAIEELNLPVKNVLKGLKTSVFYAPGSILRAVVSEASIWTAGVPGELSVYFDRSQAFEVDESARKTRQASVILSYAKQRPLESGWLLGPERIEGKAALVDVRSRLGGTSSSSVSALSTAASLTAPSGSCSMLCSGWASAPGFPPETSAGPRRLISEHLAVDVEHLRGGQAVAEGLEVLEGPDDLACRG